jgi:tetratricopeptide (TPR) repeat protein
LDIVPVKRRRFVQYLGLLAVDHQALNALSQAEATEASHTSRALARETVERYEAVSVHYRQLYWTAPARWLLQPVVSHARLGLDLLRQTSDERQERRRLAEAGALSALLAGRLAFFDLQLPAPAERYYEAATSMAEEADNRPLLAAISGHRAFIPGFGRRPGEAHSHLDRARRDVGSANDYTMSSWLASAQAEIAAVNSEIGLSLVALEQAREGLEHIEADAPPDWLEWFSRARFQSFEGYCLLKAGKPDHALGTLEAALDGLTTPNDGKQRAIVLADLADTQRTLGNLDEACRLLTDAGEFASSTGYNTGKERIRTIRAKFAPWNLEPAVKRLDEALRLL